MVEHASDGRKGCVHQRVTLRSIEHADSLRRVWNLLHLWLQAHPPVRRRKFGPAARPHTDDAGRTTDLIIVQGREIGPLVMSPPKMAPTFLPHPQLGLLMKELSKGPAP